MCCPLSFRVRIGKPFCVALHFLPVCVIQLNGLGFVCWNKVKWVSCPLSRCPNLAVKEAEDDENMDEEEVLPVLKETKKMSLAKKKKQTKNKISWVGEPIKVCELLQ